jgi:hypothetical protein
MTLREILKHLFGKRKVGVCWSCRNPIKGEPFEVEGRRFCSFYCVPAVYRARAAGVKP